MAVLSAVISSTVHDLEEHREEVMTTCGTLGVTPRVMEHLVASGQRPMDVSMDLVKDADVYIGIFGMRYGHVLPEENVSITEIELLTAEKAGIERLIFLSSEEHLWRGDQVDKGEKALRLEALRERLAKQYTCRFFDSPSDLRAKVSEALIAAIRGREPEKKAGQEGAARLQRDMDMQHCMNHLRGLTALKTMHDALHRVDIECYKPMRVYLDAGRQSSGAAFLIPAEAALELEMSVNALDLAVGILQETVTANKDLSAQRGWVDELGKARDSLGAATQSHDYSAVPVCYRQIRRVLQRQPERLNARLIDEAVNFRNSELVQRLRSGDDSADSETQRRDLQATLEKLDDLVAKHDAWQNMDFELRLVQYQTVENLEESWPMIKRQAQSIYGEDVSSWPRPLAAVQALLESPEQERDSLSLNRQFLNFCALAGQHFDKVDQSLKMTCGKAVAAFSHIGDAADSGRDSRNND